MSSTFEHLDIEFEEINKLGIAEIIALKGEGGVISEEVKQALLECFKNVAWVNEHGQEYVDALRSALYPPPYLVRISAIYTQSGTVYPTDSLDDLREDLVVTATYSDGVEMPVTAYALRGTLEVGDSTITVSYGGKIAIFDVEVTRLPNTYTITNNLVGASNSNSATYVIEDDSYSATITANESHTLVGATISITMGDVDITSTAYDDGEISIDEVTGDIEITVVAVAIVLESISAVYTQSGTVYNTDSLDVLKADLVVTATYNDSSVEVVPSNSYALSGTLEVGTSTIYVVYGGKTTSFNVTVTHSFVTLKGYTIGPNGSTLYNVGIGVNNARAVIVYDQGSHPYDKRTGVTFTEDYYPVPIPSGATSMVVTMPSALYVGVRTLVWNGSRGYDNTNGLSSSWTASADATFDVSNYNDGTWFACFTFKVGTAGTTDMRNYDMSGVSVSFS